MATPSDRQIGRDAQMPASDVDELRIALGGPDRGEMTDRPERQANQPEAQTQSKRGGERAVEDGDGSGRAAEQDVLGQRSEEHTSELQSLMRISYAVFCLKKKKTT